MSGRLAVRTDAGREGCERNAGRGRTVTGQRGRDGLGHRSADPASPSASHFALLVPDRYVLIAVLRFVTSR